MEKEGSVSPPASLYHSSFSTSLVLVSPCCLSHRRPPLERMESVLEGREKTGVPDAILLEDYLSEAAFIDNLKKRYYENLIYVSLVLLLLL